MPVGIGYDAHAFEVGRPLILGGVTIPGDRGLAGHSDADVLSHAIADAILGAAALGDIGQHFPSADPRWEGVSSLEFLRTIDRMLGAVFMKVIAVDATVIAESPALSPHRDAMRKALAAAIGISIESVSVKASTNDGMGFIGRGEGVAAIAIATLESTFG